MCDKGETENLHSLSKERNCIGSRLTNPCADEILRQEDEIRPSIVKCICVPRKPRVGDAYQVELPEPRVRE